MFQQRVAPWLSGDSGVKMLFRKGSLALGVKQKEATERKQQKAGSWAETQSSRQFQTWALSELCGIAFELLIHVALVGLL